MGAGTAAALALGAAFAGIIAYAVACDLIRARQRSRWNWANAFVARLLRASGHCDGARGYASGVRILVHDTPEGVTIQICADGGQVDPGEPGPALAAAIRAIGDSARLPRERYYDFAAEGVHESASIRALESALAGHEILSLGWSLGKPSIHPAFRALAATRGVSS